MWAKLRKNLTLVTADCKDSFSPLIALGKACNSNKTYLKNVGFVCFPAPDRRRE